MGLACPSSIDLMNHHFVCPEPPRPDFKKGVSLFGTDTTGASLWCHPCSFPSSNQNKKAAPKDVSPARPASLGFLARLSHCGGFRTADGTAQPSRWTPTPRPQPPVLGLSVAGPLGPVFLGPFGASEGPKGSWLARPSGSASVSEGGRLSCGYKNQSEKHPAELSGGSLGPEGVGALWILCG